MRQGLVELVALDPTLVLDIRYATTDNLVGRPLDGYRSPRAFLHESAARALVAVQNDLAARGLGLIVFDAYRPQRAVADLVRWAKYADEDQSTKLKFYPNVEKRDLFAWGYLAIDSAHCSGAAVDVGLLEAGSNGLFALVDMGTRFDFLDPLSRFNAMEMSVTQRQARLLLRQAMMRRGFEPCDTEWWHFEFGHLSASAVYFDRPLD